mmetsp:Transcript_79591/g.212772  ORF Transcript_79591/g.212772 Transcript_79591/m.212772 type:complete len:364 (+) Transcript_79591:18-1109(+)
MGSEAEEEAEGDTPEPTVELEDTLLCDEPVETVTVKPAPHECSECVDAAPSPLRLDGYVGTRSHPDLRDVARAASTFGARGRFWSKPARATRAQPRELWQFQQLAWASTPHPYDPDPNQRRRLSDKDGRKGGDRYHCWFARAPQRWPQPVQGKAEMLGQSLCGATAAHPRRHQPVGKIIAPTEHCLTSTGMDFNHHEYSASRAGRYSVPKSSTQRLELEKHPSSAAGFDMLPPHIGPGTYEPDEFPFKSMVDFKGDRSPAGADNFGSTTLRQPRFRHFHPSKEGLFPPPPLGHYNAHFDGDPRRDGHFGGDRRELNKKGYTWDRQSRLGKSQGNANCYEPMRHPKTSGNLGVTQQELDDQKYW